MKNIRNFCIIAHIDHGKSTIANCLLEYTKTIPEKNNKFQLLDNMDLEKERGITIKSHAVQMNYRVNNINYILNLIDTPGHTDFAHEVLKSIAACEGALLLIDANQGIEAQTISNLHLATEQNIKIIPVINKIDIPNIKIDKIKNEIKELINCKEEDIVLASGKNKIGIKSIIESIINNIPHPMGCINNNLEAIIFDSVYNPFRGIEIYFRIFNGFIKTGDNIKFLNTNKKYEVNEIGILKINKKPQNIINAGNIGYLITKIKNPNEIKTGDTIAHFDKPMNESKKIKDIKPIIFTGVYPSINYSYQDLKSAIEKLSLNDSSLIWEKESSSVLGLGFRCGFLGILHMDIFEERLLREFKIDIIKTIPSVQFNILNKQNQLKKIKSPSDMPPKDQIQYIKEPISDVNIITKVEFIGNIIKLCINKRGFLKNQIYITNTKIKLVFEMPLLEIIYNFFDQLKNISKGYASLDYKIKGFLKSKMEKLDILINGKKVDSLAYIIHSTKIYEFGKKLCEKLAELLPKEMFEMSIQAAIGNKIIAKRVLKARRKNVLSKCYGGDITRKRKLLEKQKKGKKKMKQIGKITITQNIFLSIMKIN